MPPLRRAPRGHIRGLLNWVKFGQRAGIDLRSLPYSFVALDRGRDGGSQGLSRIIGRPEHFKPYARLLNCSEAGLEVLSVPNARAPRSTRSLTARTAPRVPLAIR